jgi:hypothetical protein
MGELGLCKRAEASPYDEDNDIEQSKTYCKYNLNVQVFESRDVTNVRKSHVRQSGNGLFAAHDLPRCSVVTEYVGRVENTIKYESNSISNPDRFNQASSEHYWWDMEASDIGVDSYNFNHEPLGRGHMLNDPRSVELWNCIVSEVDTEDPEYEGYLWPTPINTGVDSNNRRLFVISKRYISKGEELFHSYGKDYWRNHDCNIGTVRPTETEVAVIMQKQSNQLE